MIAVIADDITGAAEIAGICLRYRLSTLFGVDEWPTGHAQVKIIATNSRSENEEKAVEIHKAVTKCVSQDNPEFIFKKCDSVLRGHVLAEMHAMLSETGNSFVDIQPANPVAGRIINNSHYFVNAVPLHETDFANDPDFPAHTSNIDDLLSRKKTNLSFEYQVSDCNSVNQLQSIAKSAARRKIAAGSSAFFEQLLLTLLNQPRVDCRSCFISFSIDSLLVTGSTHNQSVEYAERLEKQLIVKNFGVDEQQHPAVFFDEIKSLVQSRKSIQILVTGGATAWYLLKHLRIKSLVPEKEFAPGVVGMKALSENDICMIMKPGSYAWPIKI